jgi:hypothetical protein
MAHANSRDSHPEDDDDDEQDSTKVPRLPNGQ